MTEHSDKLKARLEALAVDEDDPETAQWARDVLDGKESLLEEEPKPQARADGGEGRNSPPPKPTTTESFNDWIREARHPGAALPVHLRWRP